MRRRARSDRDANAHADKFSRFASAGPFGPLITTKMRRSSFGFIRRGASMPIGKGARNQDIDLFSPHSFDAMGIGPLAEQRGQSASDLDHNAGGLG